MTSSLDMIRGRSNVVTLTNNSGGALAAGDVCIQDTSADEKVTTTTSAASVLKIFVAAETIASGATGKFYESGYCPLVNVNASVTRGRFLFTHTVAKQAAESATYGAGAFGKILKSGTTPSAIIYSATAQISGGAVTRSGSTTDNHLAVWDGSNADSIKDGGVPGGGSAPTSCMFFVDEATVTVGNAFTKTQDTGEFYNFWQYQNAAANGDTWTKPIFIAAGTYTISILGMTANSRGIQDVYIDATNVGSIDWYSAGLTYNVVKTIASVVIAADGAYTFKSVINGKNGSSSNYQLLLTKVWIQ